MSKMTPSSQIEASRRVQASADGVEATGREQTDKREGFASWHPVPVRLVDTVMPRLKDTELRVLLVVLRQTWGWKADRTSADREEAGTQARASEQPTSKEGAKHQFTRHQPTKRRDWLSHSQLCRRTGRGSEAVSAAVASLTASGLIIVEDAAGKALLTPEERRRCLSRLYFRPGTLWLE